MRHHPVLLDPRRAGQITRYHTFEHVRDQSVGEHSWQVARILLAIWPDCPREMLVHAVVHDTGEVYGDMAYPSKAENPCLKSAVDEIENSVRLGMTVWGLPPPAHLGEKEEYVFKTAEFVEMWEYALSEIRMGNQQARLIRDRCIAQVRTRIAGLPTSIGRATADYVSRREAHDTKYLGPENIA